MALLKNMIARGYDEARRLARRAARGDGGLAGRSPADGRRLPTAELRRSVEVIKSIDDLTEPVLAAPTASEHVQAARRVGRCQRSMKVFIGLSRGAFFFSLCFMHPTRPLPGRRHRAQGAAAGQAGSGLPAPPALGRRDARRRATRRSSMAGGPAWNCPAVRSCSWRNQARGRDKPPPCSSYHSHRNSFNKPPAQRPPRCTWAAPNWPPSAPAGQTIPPRPELPEIAAAKIGSAGGRSLRLPQFLYSDRGLR